MLVKRIKRLEGIDPRSWEHPADTAALSAVRQLKGFDDVIKALLSLTGERSLKLMALASCVRVSKAQYPRIDALMDDIVATFDWPYKPTVFLSQSPFFNAGVLGIDEPFILLNNSVLGKLDDRELTGVLAHEMGHIMSGHALYKTVIWLLTRLSASALPIPAVLIYLALAALSEWDRKSELSADRAGMLAIQSEAECYNLLVKMTGAEDMSQVSMNEFFLQAAEYESQKSLVDSLHKLLNQMFMSHPYPVIRLQELKTWADSGMYQGILDGMYLRRGVHESDARDDVKAGYEFYKAEFANSEDPIARLVGSAIPEIERTAEMLKSGFDKATGDLLDNLKKTFGPKDGS